MESTFQSVMWQRLRQEDGSTPRAPPGRLSVLYAVAAGIALVPAQPRWRICVQGSPYRTSVGRRRRAYEHEDQSWYYVTIYLPVLLGALKVEVKVLQQTLLDVHVARR